MLNTKKWYCVFIMGAFLFVIPSAVWADDRCQTLAEIASHHNQGGANDQWDLGVTYRDG